MSYWINAISRDHVQRGVEGGFTQANHGKATGLQRLRYGDWIIFYSPRTSYQNGEPLQAFTALGEVIDKAPYQFEMTPDFVPWRRQIDFKLCCEVPIRPLLDQLTFIEDRAHWGYKFRFGVFEIPAADFELIRQSMIKP